jgi:GGDEF domain-containing protein
VDYHQLLRDSLTRLPTVAATIDSIRKAVQERGELVVLYFNFDRYAKVEEVYGWEKLDSVLETTGAVMRDFLSKSALASSKLTVAFPNDDDFIFFHVPQDDTPAATDAEITELTVGLKETVSSEIERIHGEDIAALFDIFVGRALVVYNPKLRLERQIYRGIREAANAPRAGEKSQRPTGDAPESRPLHRVPSDRGHRQPEGVRLRGARAGKSPKHAESRSHV